MLILTSLQPYSRLSSLLSSTDVSTRGEEKRVYSQANKSNVKKLSKITAGEPHASQHTIL